MKRIILVLFAILYSFGIMGSKGEKKYPVSSINDELKEGANAVIREYDMKFRIFSKKKTIEYRKFAITILNENGSDLSELYVKYDLDTKINYLKGNLFDNQGNLIKKLKKSDIEDRSYVSNVSIYEDTRLQIAKLEHKYYPFTVEFEYEVAHDASYFYPPWLPLTSEKVSLEKASYRVIVPEGITIRYLEKNITNEVVVNNDNGQNTYLWKINTIKPIKREAFGTSVRNLIPSIKVTLTNFQMAGYEGDISSWQSFGSFFHELNNGRDDLPEATKNKIIELTKDETNQKEKIRKVYTYLQENTRYVSIQLGIGGLQPFKASFVDEKGYGDCKALTNYTKSMLDVIGIKSHYTLVNSGPSAARVNREFPNDYFNHVFLCVPNNQDTVWLECTSQTNPFGYLGKFTSDRDVLLITEKGGKLVHTPKYNFDNNNKLTTAVVEIDEEGTAIAETSRIFKVISIENDGMYFYLNDSYEEQKKWLYKTLDISGLTIQDFTFSSSGDFIPQITNTLKITVPKYASVNGKRMFLAPNLFSQNSYIPAKNEDRKTEILLRYGSSTKDEITYKLPEGYYPEFRPETITLESAFGSYHSEVIFEEGKVTFKRELIIKSGTYPSSSFGEFRDFLKSVAKNDKAKIVMVNAT